MCLTIFATKLYRMLYVQLGSKYASELEVREDCHQSDLSVQCNWVFMKQFEVKLSQL